MALLSSKSSELSSIFFCTSPRLETAKTSDSAEDIAALEAWKLERTKSLV